MELKTIISTSVDEDSWNDFVARSKVGTLFQTTYYADYCEDYLKIKPIYMQVIDQDSKTQGQLLLFKQAIHHRYWFENYFDFATLPLLRAFLPELYWRDGPLFLNEGMIKVALISILEAVDLIAKKEKAIWVRNVNLPILFRQNDGISQLFRKMDFHAQKWGTFIIALSKGEKELWLNLSKKARTPIRKCKKHGLYVEKVDDEKELMKYYEILVESKKRANLKYYSYKNLLKMWQYFWPINALEIFLAKKDARVIAGTGIFNFNDLSNMFGPVRSDFCYENKLDAGDLIQWEIIKWVKKSRCKVYDLTGVNPKPKT
ncbi:peptidoglycan bridge formation glycyltransferase FemA/FemB family protein, partial [bacterium]|nr:peptidoglycan bridge formation glycyltransferase FemA/FemB family protein [bacterium]